MLYNALPHSAVVTRVNSLHMEGYVCAQLLNKCSLAHAEGRICGPNDTTVCLWNTETVILCVYVQVDIDVSSTFQIVVDIKTGM